MRRLSLLAVTTALTALWLTVPGLTYVLSGPKWPTGNIVMHLQLGASSGTLIDGSPSWDASAEDALASWNAYLPATGRFTVVRNSTAARTYGNTINNVFWDDTVDGDDFGDALAVTRTRSIGGQIRETDVIFDVNESWNSYPGNLRQVSRTAWLWDVNRVALHEFGHVLGLDHPDQAGQSYPAIMNHVTGNTYTLQTDDIGGVTALYGGATSTTTPSNRAPTVSVTCNPCTLRGGQASTLSASGSDADGDSLSFAWTGGGGTFSSTSAATTRWTAPARTGATAITVTVQDGRGGSGSTTVTLQVLPGDRLAAGGVLLPGESITTTDGRYRLTYQADGTLVMVDNSTAAVKWSSGTATPIPGQAVLQTDGNFVIYNARNEAMWASGTSGNAGASVVVQIDGNLVLYSSTGTAVWLPLADSSTTVPPVTVTPAATIALTGTVTSTAGGNISGATVRILDGANAGRSTSTNSAGAYRFDGLTPANGNLAASATGYGEARAGLYIDGQSTQNFRLQPGLWSTAGAGNMVLTKPATVTRVRITGAFSGPSSNFIVWCGSRLVVNELLGTFWGSTAYDGTHSTAGCTEITIERSTGVAWTLTESR